MKKSISAALAFASALSVARIATAGTNLVVNGSFENGTYIDPTTGDTLPNNWVLGPPSPSTLSDVNVTSLVSGPLGPQSGSDYLRYQSTANNGSEDCVWQDVPTIAGAKYTFSYYVADTTTATGNNVEFHAVWDENLTNITLTYPVSSGPSGYELFSFVETASSTTTRIDFHGMDTNGSILLDNVSVVAVPEPASISLLSGGLLLLGRRRRQAIH